MDTHTLDCSEQRALRGFYEREGLVAHRYDSAHFWESRYHRKKARLVKDVLGLTLEKGDMVLDAGCGTGEMSLSAFELGGDVVSVDISKSYLKRLSRSIENRVCASLTYLPFRDKVFDVVICTDVIEHVYEYDKAVFELYYVSSKRIIVTAPCDGIFRSLFRVLFPSRLQIIDAKVGHVNILPLVQFTKRLANNDWQVASRSYHVIQPIVDDFLPAKLDSAVSLGESIADLVLPRCGTISLAIASFDQQGPGNGAFS